MKYINLIYKNSDIKIIKIPYLYKVNFLIFSIVLFFMSFYSIEL